MGGSSAIILAQLGRARSDYSLDNKERRKAIESELALQRLRTQQPFQPPQATSETVVIPPLEEDDSSPTIMMPADSIGEEEPQ